MIYRITKIGGRKCASPVSNREELIQLRNSKENLDNLKKAREGDSDAKANLLQLAYNLGHVDGALAGCKSIGSNFFHDVDCYDAEQTASYKELILSLKDQIGLKMLEQSASGGWHLVCQRQPGLTILECQVRVATLLKIEMDTSAHDLQRVVYSTSGSADDLVYLDDELFGEPMTAEQCEAEFVLLKRRERLRQEQVPSGAKKANKHYKPWEESPLWTKPTDEKPVETSQDAAETGQGSPEALVVQPIDSRTRFIFSECIKESGLEPWYLTKKGSRHQSLKSVLSVGATQLLSKPELMGVLQEFMPDNWQDENIQQLVNDFYINYTDTNRKMTIFERRIYAQSLRMEDHFADTKPQEASADAEELESESASLSSPSSDDKLDFSRVFASKLPPEMPTKLPKLLAIITRNTPKRYKATVAQACFPPLATYPQNLSFVYIDNQVRELRLNCLVAAETGSGKDSCTHQPLAHIIAEMKRRDEVNRQRLQAYNDAYNMKADNKLAPPRPDDLVIQTIKSDITKAALVQRMSEAQRAPLYVRINEIEQWDKIEGATGRNNQFTTLKILDDEINDFGTDRAGTQSVTGSGNLHLNWNANTTIPKLIRYFRHVLTDGPVSRLCLATIPVEEIGADIAVFGDYDESYDEALKPYIDNLKAATGIIDCRQAKKLAKALKHECAEFARLSQDRTFDNLTHRSLVNVFRKACLLYAANGMKWEKTIEDFCRWTLYYDMYLKMTLFGDLIRQANGDITLSKRGPRSLLDFLPDEFTLDDAMLVRQKRGLDAEHTKDMIYNWKSRGYIYQLSPISFKKASKDVTKRN